MNDKLTGLYLGTVLKHLSHGCLKVFIPSVFPSSLSASPDSLPTCMQIVPQFAGNANGNGVFSYPNISSTVVCIFANGDQNLPFTFGSIQGGIDARAQYQLIDGATNHLSAVSSDIYNQLANDDADISSVSHQHRFTIGSSSLTFDEDGSISAQIENPTTTHINENVLAESFARMYMQNISGAPALSIQTITKDVDSIMTMDATGDINLQTKTKDATYFIDLTTKGTITLNANGESTIVLDKDGNITINSSKTIVAKSKDITIQGSSSVAIKAPDISIDGSTVNINGGSGDCIIDSTSLNNHTHPFPYVAGISPSMGTTMAPVP